LTAKSSISEKARPPTKLRGQAACALLCLRCEVITPLDYLSAEHAPEASDADTAPPRASDAGNAVPSQVDAPPPSTDNVADTSLDYASVVRKDSPLGYWRFGEPPSVTQAGDEMGLHPGAYVGGVDLGIPGALASDPNTAVALDGNSGHIAFGPIFPFAGTAAFSLEAWINPVSNDTKAHRIVNNRNDAGSDGYRLILDADHLLKCERWGAGTVGRVSAVPALNQFSHVVCTYDGTQMKLFINGAEVNAAPSSNAMSPNMFSLTVGTLSSASGDYFAGELDEFAIYEAALTAQRVLAHFQAGRPN
jgi:hypothetical protein